MKVIDIMQKLANGENIKKFRIDDVSYYVDKSNYICEEDGTKVEWFIDDEWLNVYAEIIEEDKKIEKLDKYADISGDLACEWSIAEKKLKDKINEIIDYIMEDK